MRQLLRTVLIWLVVLAVPAQGMAAVSMMHCGPGHHGAQVTQGMAPTLAEISPVAPGGQAAHGHAVQAGHTGHASHAAAHAGMASASAHLVASSEAADTAQPGKVIAPVEADDPSYKKCSACAACCAGLALSGTAVKPPTTDSADEVTVSALFMAASVVIDGLERPPRILRV